MNGIHLIFLDLSSVWRFSPSARPPVRPSNGPNTQLSRCSALRPAIGIHHQLSLTLFLSLSAEFRSCLINLTIIHWRRHASECCCPPGCFCSRSCRHQFFILSWEFSFSRTANRRESACISNGPGFIIASQHPHVTRQLMDRTLLSFTCEQNRGGRQRQRQRERERRREREKKLEPSSSNELIIVFMCITREI